MVFCFKDSPRAVVFSQLWIALFEAGLRSVMDRYCEIDKEDVKVKGIYKRKTMVIEVSNIYTIHSNTDTVYCKLYCILRTDLY